MIPIKSVADRLGLNPDVLINYGPHMAKIPMHLLPGPDFNQHGKLVVVTAMTPTPAGEGKTTTSIGLVNGLSKLGHKAVLTIREPSIGPVFGIKGGGTGGGNSKVLPEDEINLHFTGDAHAVASAHSLLSAMTDNAVQRGQIAGVFPEDIIWPRVTNVPDRSLRTTVTGLGGSPNAPLRESAFRIDAASEVMAVLALSDGLEDLRMRLGRLVVAFSKDKRPITAENIGAVGSMLALLRRAIEPNLVQTNEGNPAIVHAGPFGNIAHGCSSVIADRLALSMSDFVITEAGFGADLGFEKFIDIKCRESGLTPSAAVVVATTRALKWHGGVPRKELESENMRALESGSSNLEHALKIVRAAGLPAVVAINRFPSDSPSEIARLKQLAESYGAMAAVESFAFTHGGDGATDLAEAVNTATKTMSQVKYAYESTANLQDKVHALATTIYNASEVEWEPVAKRKIRQYEENGWGQLPVCMAKTHLSISHNPRLKGAPKDYRFPIRDVQISAGAGFVYTLAGEIQTLMGLPGKPNAIDIDVNDKGEIIGLF
jgi:formate--tetrahydrofolate ligase